MTQDSSLPHPDNGQQCLTIPERLLNVVAAPVVAAAGYLAMQGLRPPESLGRAVIDIGCSAAVWTAAKWSTKFGLAALTGNRGNALQIIPTNPTE